MFETSEMIREETNATDVDRTILADHRTRCECCFNITKTASTHTHSLHIELSRVEVQAQMNGD